MSKCDCGMLEKGVKDYSVREMTGKDNCVCIGFEIWIETSARQQQGVFRIIWDSKTFVQ